MEEEQVLEMVNELEKDIDNVIFSKLNPWLVINYIIKGIFASKLSSLVRYTPERKNPCRMSHISAYASHCKPKFERLNSLLSSISLVL